jgi:tRNA/rRNA methyltransferase
MTRARDMPAPIAEAWPAIVLVRPQMGENIGAAARAMMNFGLVSMRLVDPRDRWPNPKATAVAAGADAVLEAARVEWSVEDAVADATLVVAATARPRSMEKPVWGPRTCAQTLRAAIARGEKPVVLFGAEATGLTSEEVSRADAIVTFPVNPAFASVNLSTSVGIFAFAYAEARQETDAPSWFSDTHDVPAEHAELEGFFQHLETELGRGRFYHPPDKTPLMRQNLRNTFLKARLTAQEVRTLRGMLKALTIGRGGRKQGDA